MRDEYICPRCGSDHTKIDMYDGITTCHDCAYRYNKRDPKTMTTKKLTEKDLEDFDLTDEQKKAIPKINDMVSQLNFYTGQEFHVYPDEYFIVANKKEKDDYIYFTEQNIQDVVDLLEGLIRICTHVIIQDDMEEDELIK